MRKAIVAALCLALLLPLAARAQAAATPAHTEKGDFLVAYDRTAKQIRDLAAAIPEAKYAWRPAEGVRSVKEVVRHIANGGYFLTGFLGVAAPAGAPKSMADGEAMEKQGNKAEALAALDASLNFVRGVAEAATPEELNKEVDFFGQKVSGRMLFLFVHGHMSEHLGQLIAYARMNGVVPPWSASGK